MYSLSFPNMFSSSSTKLIKDTDATKSNLYLILKSNKLSFEYDPDFGCNLGKVFYEKQLESTVPELVIDMIYSAIQQFMPQVVVSRKDINIVQVGTQLLAQISGVSKIDGTTMNYVMRLIDLE